ncbi:hypothetical protein M9H77_23653 [Catharanthus roseus]|uniref:Uncharacterized protein n=1 Tax=Catharanthus roseus TaxID=4058 RepID=A0ACC0ATX8_CATRO|nr:hypothetical protein M9H77_23653 [Catharanthus roseus]
MPRIGGWEEYGLCFGVFRCGTLSSKTFSLKKEDRLPSLALEANPLEVAVKDEFFLSIMFFVMSHNAMSQGKKVAIGFQSYDLTRIANVRVPDMFLAEAAFPTSTTHPSCLSLGRLYRQVTRTELEGSFLSSVDLICNAIRHPFFSWIQRFDFLNGTEAIRREFHSTQPVQ